MKLGQKFFAMGLLALAGLTFAGCSETDKKMDKPETPAGTSDPNAGSNDKPDNASTATSSDFQLVSLKVPNMTCSMCAKSVRDALVNVDGIEKDSIKTDPSEKIVSFKAKKGLDLNSSLAAHADNSHLKDWSVAEN